MLKMIGDKILVERSQTEEKTSGGLYLPDDAKEKSLHGTVISVGQGRYNSKGQLVPVAVSVGDKVMFNKFGATGVKFGDKEYLVMKEEDVIGVLQ